MKQQIAINEHDMLYEEAVKSLKQLNQEILFDDLSNDLKQLQDNIKDEVDEFVETIDEKITLLNANVSTINAGITTFTTQTQMNLTNTNNSIGNTIKGFAGHFNKKVVELLKDASSLNNTLLENIRETILQYEQKFTSINEQHTQLTEQSKNSTDALQQLVITFNSDVQQKYALLQDIQTNWVVSIAQIQQNLVGEIEQLKTLVANNEQLVNDSKQTLLNEMAQLTDLNEQLQKFLLTQKELQEATKRELLSTMDDFKNKAKIEQAEQFKAFKNVVEQFQVELDGYKNTQQIQFTEIAEKLRADIQQTNEQQQQKFEVIVETLLTENKCLKQELQQQSAKIKSNHMLTTAIMIMTLLGVIALIVLQFV